MNFRYLWLVVIGFETFNGVEMSILSSICFVIWARYGHNVSGELERPLVSDDEALVRDQSNDLTRNYDLEGACYQNEGLWRSPRAQGLVHKQRLSSASPHATHGDSVVLDVISDASEDLSVGQTLKRPLMKDHLAEVQKYGGQEDQSPNLKLGLGIDRFPEFLPKAIADQSNFFFPFTHYERLTIYMPFHLAECVKHVIISSVRSAGSCLSLEVVSGPSRGIRCSVQSANASRLPLTLGRVSPSDVLLKDSEVSGKHALINWNPNKLKWELVDMGSLNGTLLNSQPINHPDSGSRHWGKPMELTSGDIITLGTTSSIHVQITSETVSQIPFGVGVASDPMALRRGAKKLPMEDVCYYHWPLPGVDKFGLFGICDGHGGSAAAKSASEILPKMVAAILSDSLKRERLLSQCDASDVLRDAFFQTEASMNHHYEGCTATVLLVWADGNANIFAQCANVGDSACVMNVDGKQIKMSEDHRIASYSERLRIQETGEPLKDGETRLCGSDGFWDVISVKKAIQLVVQMREKYSADKENSTEKIANVLLSEARTLRTKDNTSIIFLDFDSTFRMSCKVDS
ncbi:protein phosphatase 2C 70 [Citrus sinensis]|nr:protein phosphatase 2C 70 [Citrus sinensis]